MENYPKLENSQFILVIGNKMRKRVHTHYVNSVKGAVEILKEYRRDGVEFDENTTYIYEKQCILSFNNYVRFSSEEPIFPPK